MLVLSDQVVQNWGHTCKTGIQATHVNPMNIMIKLCTVAYVFLVWTERYMTLQVCT